MKSENNEQLRQELRLAQLEIKLLHEQLVKSIPPAQRTPDKFEQPTADGPAEFAKSTIIPMTPEGPGTRYETETVTHSDGGPRVLYVEDSEPNFRLVKNILADRPGTDLAWAETGQKGLDMARSQNPQLVLLDLDLPDMHGSKVLEELQAQSETARTPVIVISADATPSQIERMLTAGARNYLTKPFEIRRFLCMFDEIFVPA